MKTRTCRLHLGHSVRIIGLGLILGATPLTAQTGVLLVRVTGPASPVPNARVEILFQGDVLRWADTDLQGMARLGGVPGGTFDLRVQALGFHTEIQQGVRVDPGTSRALEIRMEVAPLEVEGLTVRAERVQIQRENTEFSTQVDEVAIRLLPTTYDARDIVALTPGARPGHIWGGSSYQANSYRIDGVVTNHPGLGGNLLEPNINWIDRVEVRGLGAGAEFGGFQGGLVDLVTKQGTDELQGFVRTGFEHDALSGSNLVKTEIGTEVVSRYDLEGELRGPLVEDKLFFYLSGKRIGQELKALNHLRQLEKTHTPFFEERVEEKVFGKLRWTPGPTHRVEVSAAYTNTRADNYELTGFEAEGATHEYSAPTLLVNASAREFLGGWALLEARVNHFTQDERYDPYQGQGVPGVSNFALTPPYNAFQNAPFTLRSAPTSTSVVASATIQVRTGELEHSLKVGGEYNWGSFLNQRIRNGGLTWLGVNWSGFDPALPFTWTHPGSASYRIFSQWGGEVRLDADVMNSAAFAQSSISLGPRLVFSPGIRMNRWKGWITPTSGARFLAVQDDGIDPRVGMALELTGDGTFMAKAHWGRYHQNLISQMYDRVEGADVFTNEEIWYRQGTPFTDPTTTVSVEERNALAQTFGFVKQGEVVLNETGPVRDYRQPYVDQWLLGLEKQVGNWLKFEALYAHRSNENMVALVDLNRATNYTRFEGVRVFDAGGSVVPYGGGSVFLQELYLPNNLILARLRCKANADCPDALPVPGLTYADTVNLSWDPRFALTNAPGAKREFRQLQFNVEVAKPNWGASFSFVRTWLAGNLDNVSGYTDPEGFGAGPYVRVNEAVNAYGTLENFSDREWKTALWGILPGNIRGGLFWTFRSGDHYSPRFRLYGLGFFHYRVNTGALTPTGIPQYRGEDVDFMLMGPLEGHHVFVGPRGRPVLKRWNILDVRLERMFRFQEREVSLSLDVFNLLRAEAVTRINTVVNNGPDYGFSIRPSIFAPPLEPNQYYAAPQERVRPTSVRLGFAVYF